MDILSVMTAFTQVMNLIKSTGDALNTLRSLLKNNKPLRNEIIKIEKQLSETRQLMINLQQLVLDLQNHCASERKEKERALEELAGLKKNLNDINKYAPAEIGRGVIVYAPKCVCDPPEKRHYLCANCAARGEKSFLQPECEGDAEYLVCHHCHSRLILKPPKSFSCFTWGG